MERTAKMFIEAAREAKKRWSTVALPGGWTITAEVTIRRGANATDSYTLTAPGFVPCLGGKTTSFDRYSISYFAKEWAAGRLEPVAV